MELELLSKDKLKITLTGEDMRIMDITYDDMNEDDDTVTKRVFWDILDKAKRHTGFDVSGDRILIQIEHSQNNNGCQILVTKLGNKRNTAELISSLHFGGLAYSKKNNNAENENRHITNSNKPLQHQQSQNGEEYNKSYKKIYSGIKRKRVIYMFENSENLYQACRQLSFAKYSGKSDIFSDESKYYLYIEAGEKSLDLISEYGFLMNNPFFGFYLEEHAEKILEDYAVHDFAEIFG